MRSFNLSYKKTAPIPKKSFDKLFSSLDSYHEELQKVVRSRDFGADEASVLLPDDERIKDSVRGLAAKKKKEVLKYVIVIGIGGSNLGTKAIYEALRPDNDPYPRMLFSETVSTDELNTLYEKVVREVVMKEEIALVLVSKSGKTTEALANFEILNSRFERKYGDLRDRIVVVSNEGTPLALVARERGIDALIIPEKVGGRYSVLSAVGLFPLALCDMDIQNVLHGAREMRDESLFGERNLARESAVVTYHHYKKKKIVNNLFVFNPEFRSLGLWYRQLLAESLGKKKNKKGKVVHGGMLPIVSVGSTDLHSVAQLFFGGPQNIFTSIVYFEKSQLELRVPEDPFFGEIVKGTAGKTAHQLMDAIIEGVKAAYKKTKLPYLDITLEEVSEYTIGQFLQFKMLEVMYLGVLMNVNAFNQPSVEIYKEETRKILEQ